jgi:hypothetical protein
LKLLKFGLQEKKGKEKQTKLENEEQGRNCKGNKLSGFRSRELHQKNLKSNKIN